MGLNIFAIDRSEPRIHTVDAPIRVAGISIPTGLATVYRDVPAAGKEFRKIRDTIPCRRQPWAFAAISHHFSSDGQNWDYLMGDVVTSFFAVPQGLATFEIPPGTYAVFSVRPAFSFLFGLHIGRTKRFIFTEWLPASDFEADTSVLGDFEYHDERSLGRHPMIEIFVPVRRKGI